MKFYCVKVPNILNSVMYIKKKIKKTCDKTHSLEDKEHLLELKCACCIFVSWHINQPTKKTSTQIFSSSTRNDYFCRGEVYRHESQASRLNHQKFIYSFLLNKDYSYLLNFRKKFFC